MKNLILTFAILISGFSLVAFSNNYSPEETITISLDQEFTEVPLDELPETIKTAVLKDYAGATVTKAFVNTKEQYKLKLIVKETTSFVYADKDGNWLQESDIKHTEKK